MFTMPQIINKLAKYDIEAQRKSIYDDLSALYLLEIDIHMYLKISMLYKY